MSVPTDPGDLPEVLRATPQPLVGFVGLNPEASAQHRRVWESFTSNRGPDRHAFNFLPLDLDTVELPVGGPEPPASLLTLPGEWEWWQTEFSSPLSGAMGPGAME